MRNNLHSPYPRKDVILPSAIPNIPVEMGALCEDPMTRSVPPVRGHRLFLRKYIRGYPGDIPDIFFDFFNKFFSENISGISGVKVSKNNYQKKFIKLRITLWLSCLSSKLISCYFIPFCSWKFCIFYFTIIQPWIYNQSFNSHISFLHLFSIYLEVEFPQIYYHLKCEYKLIL